jgi:uncharacterized membrane protein
MACQYQTGYLASSNADWNNRSTLYSILHAHFPLPFMPIKSPLLKPAPESTHSAIAIAGHPVHAMMVSFPVAFVLGGLASDLAYWWTGDPFWARVSLWIIGAAFVMGSLAGVAGTLDFMIAHKIRRHVSSWSHFIAAVMLISLAAANWWQRVPEPEQAVLPWGLFMSAVSAASLALVGWFGGKLVFHHHIGHGDDETV